MRRNVRRRVQFGAVCLAAAVVMAAGGLSAAQADSHNTRSLNTAYEEPVSQHDSTHFRVHYTTSGKHASTPAYAAEVADVFEQVWADQIGTDTWPAPATDGGLGGDDRTDVYLRERSTLPQRAHVLSDRSQSPSGFEPDCDPQHCTDVSGFIRMATDMDDAVLMADTAAHEFNHLVQYAMAYHAGRWMYEGTATWVEREQSSRPGGPHQAFVEHPEIPLAQDEVYELLYGSWVWNRWIADRHGPAVVSDAWAAVADADQEALGGYAAALAQRGTTFAEEFREFAAATAAWQHEFPWDGFTDSFRRHQWPAAWNMRREDGVVAPGQTRTTTLDHTAYALYDLSDLGRVEVRATTTADITGGVALVADRGLHDVTRVTAPFEDGVATVSLDGQTADTELTAVVVNADRTVAEPFDPDNPFDPIVYAHDDVDITLEVDGEPPAPPDDQTGDQPDDGQPPSDGKDSSGDEAACPPDQVADAGFTDVAGTTHEASIDCVVWWGIARGVGGGSYAPTRAVTRGQMATFLANMITRTGGHLPADVGDAFVDDAGTTHEANINRLAAAGVVAGTGPGTYHPTRAVTRGQMATFLVRAYLHRTGMTTADLAAPRDVFTDDAGTTHETNINHAAGLGFAAGVSGDRYAPTRAVTRGQMATFLARTLNAITARGLASPPSDGQGADAGLTDDSRLDIRGVGAVEAGMTIREAASVTGNEFEFQELDTFGGYCYYARPEGVSAYQFMVGAPGDEPVDDPRDGVIVSVTSGYEPPNAATVQGVAPGDPREKVERVYGAGQLVERPHAYQPDGAYLDLEGTGADDGFGMRFVINGQGLVEAIHSGDRLAVRAPEGCA